MTELVANSIYCDVHGCVHEETNDPYDYGYKLSGETPECEELDWHKLWIIDTMDISKTTAEDLLDWYERLCDGEVNAHDDRDSLPFSSLETREEIIRRMEKYK